jgi:PAS domain S-box-containing protein
MDDLDRTRLEREYATILRTATDGFWICDTQGRILQINDSLCRMLGYTREEMLSMVIPDIEAMETSEEVAQHIETVIENGYDNFESCLRHKDGGLIDIEASVSYLDAVGGRIFAFIRDITERKRAEEALQNAYDQLELRVQERTAELQRANEALKAEITGRGKAQQEAERSHQRESVLNTLLRISMEDTSLEEQLERALDEILSIPWLPVLRQGGLFLVEGEPDVLELSTHRGLSPSLQTTCARVDFGWCVCGRAAARGEIEFSDRVDECHEIRYEGTVPHGHYCVPILSGDTVIGVLVLYLEEGHQRDAQQEEFLQAAAHTVAGIIERKRAEHRLRELNEQLEDYSRNLEQKVAKRTREIERRRQVAESLRDILTVLNSGRPLDEALECIVTEASRLLGSDTSAIYRLAERDETFSIQTVMGSAVEVAAKAGFPPGLAQALRDGWPVPIPDVATAVPWDSVPGLQQTTAPVTLIDCCQALLAVPLVVTNEVYGGLVLYYSEPRAFSDDEVGLAVAFADQATLAIESARLRQQAREAAVIEERGRLARELHDSVTQSLYSLTLLAEGWRRLAKAGRLNDTDDPMREVGEIAQQALREMRLMVHELRPPALEEEGLLGALHQRLGAVEKRAGIEARLVAEDVVKLPAPMEEGLYRIAVEALNNALKHAAATSVTVYIRTDEERVELVVKDNGRGFDIDRMDESGGMGLDSMRERAERLGGSVTIRSTPDGGTRVSVTVPLSVQPVRIAP